MSTIRTVLSVTVQYIYREGKIVLHLRSLKKNLVANKMEEQYILVFEK